jgi:hypothetical protein
MKILFDNGTPKPIARSLAGHEIAYARRVGWHELENGELIRQAEEAGRAGQLRLLSSVTSSGRL